VIGEVVLTLVLSSTVAGDVPPCAIEDCPAPVLRRLWLAERRARIQWEIIAADRRGRIAALERDRDRRRALELPPAPPPCPPASSPVGWMAGSCAVCAAAGAGAAGGACALLSR
jgi:hypothetical protein